MLEVALQTRSREKGIVFASVLVLGILRRVGKTAINREYRATYFEL